MKNLDFNNAVFGSCSLQGLNTKEELLEFLGGPFFSPHKDTLIEKSIIYNFLTSVELYGHGLYRVCTSSGLFLGFSYFFHNAHPEIFYFIFPEHRGNGVALNAVELLTDFAFRKTRVAKIVVHADEPKRECSDAGLKDLGFLETGEGLKYEVTRVDRGLCQLAKIIREKPMEFIPRPHALVKYNMHVDLYRVFGSLNDLPFESARKAYLEERIQYGGVNLVVFPSS